MKPKCVICERVINDFDNCICITFQEKKSYRHKTCPLTVNEVSDIELLMIGGLL